MPDPLQGSVRDGTCVYLIKAEIKFSNNRTQQAFRPSSMCWRVSLPARTSCWFSTARPTTAAATLPFPTTSRPLAARAQQRERVRRIGLLINLAADDPEPQVR